MVKASMMSPVPVKTEFSREPDFILRSRNEFRCGKVLPLAKRLDAHSCAAAQPPRKATETLCKNRAVAYISICSMVKASMMSPSLMSLNFSMDKPHS
jgi:hypothetical protein